MQNPAAAIAIAGVQKTVHFMLSYSDVLLILALAISICIVTQCATG